MKLSLLALSTAAAFGGTDAFMAPQQPRLASSALAGYGIGSWNKKSSPSSSGGGGAAVATRNPWDDANKTNTVSKSDTFIKAPTTKKSYGLGSWNKSASPRGAVSPFGL